MAQETTIGAGIYNLLNRLYKLRRKYVTNPDGDEFQEIDRLIKRLKAQQEVALMGKLKKTSPEFKKAISELEKGRKQVIEAVKNQQKYIGAIKQVKKVVGYVDKVIDMLT